MPQKIFFSLKNELSFEARVSGTQHDKIAISWRKTGHEPYEKTFFLKNSKKNNFF